MAFHNDMNFITRDSDNDQWSKNCAINVQPARGWWYKYCMHVQLNVVYNDKYGGYLNNKWHTLPFIEMKIRPHNCNI